MLDYVSKISKIIRCEHSDAYNYVKDGKVIQLRQKTNGHLTINKLAYNILHITTNNRS